MMSKKQLACMLTLHIIYLLLGASIFYHIESPLEMAQRAEEKLERLEIQNLLYENYIPTDPDKQDSILKKLSEYCGKSMFNYTTEDEETPIKWDFYHSFFFSYTVVSTIGYGNLAPTTHLSRILMIFYGLFGIPINGILLANLGEYFGLQLITVYRRYKRRDERRADILNYFFLNLGMLGQIFLYLVPGFLFFIFLPACIFVVFEGWDYVAAVYYAFVTLTTIGFGDLVAGTINNGFAYSYFVVYQIFLMFWITFGLGYIVMLLGFITSGMRSESVHKLEQKIANQWKSTQNRILTGFSRDMNVIRKLINEANLIKLKPVYVETAPYLYRSKSCPTLTYDVEPRGPIYKRKRANSENIQLTARDMLRIQSDTDLLGIDKEKTFTASAIVKPAELLARVVNVLGGLEQQQEEKGVHLFEDEQILASEKQSKWSIGLDAIQAQRTRALSVAVPNYRKESVTILDNDFSLSNGDSNEKLKEAINKRAGKMSLPAVTVPQIEEVEKPVPPKSILSKIFKRQSSVENPAEYIKHSMKGRVSNVQAHIEKPKGRRGSIFPSFNFGGAEEKSNPASAYMEKTKRGRGSIFPSFDFNHDEDEAAKAYQEKTKRGRTSIFPTFDFSEDEDKAAAKAYREKSKRHSIFPTFDFSEDEDDAKAAKAYREKTRSGRHSIFPTFDFSESEDDMAQKYKETTKRGRRSIFPTFDFNDKKDDNDDEDDTVDEEEVRKYQSRTQRGRLSLFPTFGKAKKPQHDDVVDEDSEELQNYQNKTRRGRGSLFPTFGKDRKASTSEDSNDVEADIKKYQSQTKRGRGSLFVGNQEEESVDALEQTSVADLLRALAALDTVGPGKRGSIDSPGLLDVLVEASAGGHAAAEAPKTRRRGSVHPDFAMLSAENLEKLERLANRGKESEETASTVARRRRVSARAAAPGFTPTLATVVAGAELQTTATSARENRMNKLTNPAEATEASELEEAATGATEAGPRARRFSPAPGGPRAGSGPVSRLSSRMRKESVASIEEENESSSRRGSLTDVVIDNNKDNT